MIYRVVFSPEAEEQLAALYHYIAGAAAPDIAARYTESIVSYCESLQTFPHRGFKRDDVRPGLRITNYKKGETRSSHLRCCASLKEEWLFLRSRASHLAASRLAENEK